MVDKYTVETKIVEQAIDLNACSEYLKRYYNIKAEQKTLSEDLKELNAEFKKRIPQKTISGIRKMVQTELDLQNQNVSPETIHEIGLLVKENIGKVM